jgi:hypothetical protein
MTDESPAPVDTWRSPIKTAGVYPDIPMERYHGATEICPGPSISSSGLKLFESDCPYRYWYDSPLNPNRPEREDKAHFKTGRLLHELLAEPEADVWRRWHILPAGFTEAHGKKWELAIAERDAVIQAGREPIAAKDAATAQAMLDAIRRHPHAPMLFKGGQFEPTLAWKDEETGIWCRVRPDFLPTVRQFIPDLKSAADVSPTGFERASDKFFYHMSAALYIEGIRVLFGERPKAFMFVAQEKTEPYITEIYQLQEDALAWGRVLNRRALRKFARCLDEDKWPTYGGAVNSLGLPQWTLKNLELDVKSYLLEVPE